jgi:hypothetical protein
LECFRADWRYRGWGDQIAEMASSTKGSAILIIAGWIAMKHWLTRQSKA